MPRKPTEDLQKVNLAPVARQANTFVFGRRASKTNTALQLADSLGKGSKIALDIGENQRKENLEQVEMDIQTATDNKLAGGNLFSDTYRENIADYEEIKGTLKTPEDAAKWFVERNAKQFPDRHQQAGYDSKLRSKMTDFIAQHNKFVVSEKIKGRNVNLTKSFYNDVLEGETQQAFDDLTQATKNYGASPAQTNALVFESVKAMLAQGRVDKAEEVLNHQRGAAKSLVENPETAVEAKQLMDRVVSTREAIKDARFEDAKVENRIAESKKIENENKFYDEVLNNPELTNAQKVLQLENAMGNFEINKEFRDVMKRTLTARKGGEGVTNNEVYSNLIAKTNNLAAISGDDEGDYLKGLRNIRLEMEEAINNGEISGAKDIAKLRKQINSLSNKKEATALAEVANIFKTDANKFIERNVAPQNRGTIIKDVFFATEQLRDEIATAKENGDAMSNKEIKARYLEITEETVKKFKGRLETKAKQTVEEVKGNDPVSKYMTENAITEDQLDAKAKSESERLGRPVTIDDIKRGLRKQLEGQESQDEVHGSAGNDAILDLIGTAESKGNYNVMFGGKEKPLTTMSVGDVLKMQQDMRSKGADSTAAGKYQIIYKTLNGLVKNNKIDKDALFDEDMQDNLAKKLLAYHKSRATKNGKLDKQKFAKELAKEWASLPVNSTGSGYYDGDGLNKAQVPFSKVEEVLASL